MEAKPPKVTPTSKGKKKILVEEESESEWEKDVDAVIEEDISKVTQTKEARSDLRDLIANIISEEPAATTPTQAATQQTPTKSLVTTPMVSSKCKEA